MKIERIKLKAYAVFMLLFLLYLLFADRIILSKINNYTSSLYTIDFDEIKSNTDAYYSFEKLEILDGMFNQVYFVGWAYCETTMDNSNKKVYLVFKGDGIDYISDYSLAINRRPDVQLAFPDKKVFNARNHFTGEFSTIIMKNGSYDLYLYVEENEFNYGLVNTGKKFVKDYRGFRKYEPQIIENKPDIQICDSMKYSIDSNKSEGEFLAISGWAFIEGKESKNQYIYLEIKDVDGNKFTMETNQYQRLDVGTYFADDRYNTSGFSTNIPLNLISSDYTIRVIVENDGVFASE